MFNKIDILKKIFALDNTRFALCLLGAISLGILTALFSQWIIKNTWFNQYFAAIMISIIVLSSILYILLLKKSPRRNKYSQVIYLIGAVTILILMSLEVFSDANQVKERIVIITLTLFYLVIIVFMIDSKDDQKLFLANQHMISELIKEVKVRLAIEETKEDEKELKRLLNLQKQ
ncbi:hypothetical protein HOE31_02615 [bacterium]|nr:hypothetical protein [bacterium]MBT4335310.1 hypothetical protein [bacterium]MBT4495396.1 hypothetical protein [bacterium]MBT4763621.1 hypothetical protein [bacterium]MBT5400993.1 hypothetical protein [bacterium]